MPNDQYLVYVKVNTKSQIVAVNSSAFLKNTEGWVKIDEGSGDRYHHAQGNYLENGLYTEDGVPRYKLADGKPVERTEEERQADRVEKVSLIPSPSASAAELLRVVFDAQREAMDDDQLLRCSGLAQDWAAGNHAKGEIYNANGQTWECFQAYDNAVYSDITPGAPSWYTFNRPLHGRTPETARPFVPVQGAHDMYRSGEYMIFTDGKTYLCKSDTNFSPKDYPQAWEVWYNEE